MLTHRKQARKVYRHSSHHSMVLVGVLIFGGLILLAIVNADEADVVIVGVACLLVVLAIFARAAWSGISATDEGIHVANFFRSYSLKWTEIDRFDLGRYWLLPDVCLIYTTAGKRMCASAVHEGAIPANGSGRAAVKELTRELAQEREKHGGPASGASKMDDAISTS